MRARLLALVLLLPALGGCSDPAGLVLATTTSTENTGLLAFLLPEFERATRAEVKVVAVGTGRALELGARGDADLVLVHAPAAERAHLRDGTFVERREVMRNQFLLVGPPADPAGVAHEANVTAAFARLLQQRAPFVSRGDQSGTHLREQELWAAAGIDYASQVLGPGQAWYHSVGQGMEATLRIADQLQAYTLTDDGTYWAAAAPGLAVLRAEEPPLRNQYSVLLPNATRHAHLRADLAGALADWFVDPATQARIASFVKHGHQLFTPNAGAVERV